MVHACVSVVLSRQLLHLSYVKRKKYTAAISLFWVINCRYTDNAAAVCGTHTHTHVHCVPPLYTHEQQFLPVVLPAQLKPDTTADTAEMCRHSTTCINITRTGRACPFLCVACRHWKCVGGREGRWGDQKMTHVWRQLRVEAGNNNTLHLFSSFVFSLRVVVAWTKGVCARDESSHWASPRLPPPARLI